MAWAYDNHRLITVYFLLTYLVALQAETGMRIDRTVTFGPNDDEAAINFTVEDDLIALEPNEIFEWELSLVTAVDRGTVEPHSRTIFDIIDNDGKILIHN